ncbi:hypothetical protein V5O48_011033, partial [Marasmius crinis-equi]
YEAKWAINPIVPISLLSNRSSLSGYIQNFVAFLELIVLNYFFSLYAQACKDASPMRAGVVVLPAAICVGVFVILSGVSVTITKRYRPQIWIAWVLAIVGTGVMIPLGPQSSYPHLIGVSVIPMTGAAILAAAGYFPVLAPLEVTQNAYALAFFAFGRTFAGVWGISIGNTVFQNELQKRLSPELVEALGVGDLSADKLYALVPEIRFLSQPAKGQLQQAIGASIGILWAVLTGIGGIGLLASLLMKNIPLQNVRDEKWTTGNLATNRDGDIESRSLPTEPKKLVEPQDTRVEAPSDANRG